MTITFERETRGKWADAMTVYATGNPLKTAYNPHITTGLRYKIGNKYHIVSSVEVKGGTMIIKSGEKDGT